jgi:hypothetical protein
MAVLWEHSSARCRNCESRRTIESWRCLVLIVVQNCSTVFLHNVRKFITIFSYFPFSVYSVLQASMDKESPNPYCFLHNFLFSNLQLFTFFCVFHFLVHHHYKVHHTGLFIFNTDWILMPFSKFLPCIFLFMWPVLFIWPDDYSLFS